MQETYRRWIDEKLLEYERKGDVGSERSKLDREDIIRRLRKLREGLLASNRDDAFATEVYETSLYLAAAYGVSDQVTAVSAQILPPSRILSPKASAKITQDRNVRGATLFLIMLHHLRLATLSASSLQWVVVALSHPFVTHNLSDSHLCWLKQVVMAWRCGNHHKIWNLTSNQTLDTILLPSLTQGPRGRREMAAFVAEAEGFRCRVREMAWKVTVTAYREESEPWLLRSLSLASDDTSWISTKQKTQEALLVPGDKPRWKLFRSKTSG